MSYISSSVQYNSATDLSRGLFIHDNILCAPSSDMLATKVDILVSLVRQLVAA